LPFVGIKTIEAARDADIQSRAIGGQQCYDLLARQLGTHLALLKSPWREPTKQALNAQMTKGTSRVFSTFGFRHSFVLRHLGLAAP
jgi:hypothetical protein